MGERRYAVTVERLFEAPARLLWALVADNDRWDRASELTPGRYEWRKDARGVPVRAASAVELGFAIEWIEPPFEWVEGHFMFGLRRFVKGPVASGGFTARCHAEGAQTRVIATAFVTGEGGVILALGPIMRLRFRRALDGYLGSVQKVLAQAGGREADAGSDAPAFERIRPLLAQSLYPLTHGPRSAVNVGELEQRPEALRRAPVQAQVVDRIARQLAERPDEEVAQMRPFELARAWGLGRRDVLRGFLHATAAGLCDLRWQTSAPQ